MIEKTHEILARLMDAKGLNQAALARETGLNQSTISRILNPDTPKGIRSPSERQTRPLATFFGVTVDQLRGHQRIDLTDTIHTEKTAATGFEGKDIGDPVGWLQLVAEVKDPQVLRALRGIASIFTRPEMTADDAIMLEAITQRFFQAARLAPYRDAGRT